MTVLRHFTSNLYNLFYGQLKDDYKKNKGLNEFVMVVSNIISHKLGLLNPNDISNNDINNIFIQLHNDMNIFRDILKDFPKYISPKIKYIYSSEEFPNDKKTKISDTCKNLINYSLKNPDKFFHKYFIFFFCFHW